MQDSLITDLPAVTLETDPFRTPVNVPLSLSCVTFSFWADGAKSVAIIKSRSRSLNSYIVT